MKFASKASRFASALLLASVALFVVGPASLAKDPPGKPPAYRDIRWEELVPKDWDPMKSLRAKNLDGLSDADPRSMDMMRELREIFDHAPTDPKMNGAVGRLPGYVVPLESGSGGLKEFLLVPYFGACIHTPPPPANMIVHVVLAKPLTGFRSMDAVWVSGARRTARRDTSMGVSAYAMDGVHLEHYVPPERPAR